MFRYCSVLDHGPGQKRVRSFSDLRSHHAPQDADAPGWNYLHLGILRPQGLDPLGYVAIVDVAAVNLKEVAERGRLVSSVLERGRKLVMQCGAGLLIDAGQSEGFFVPADGCFWDSFFKEALRQPGV